MRGFIVLIIVNKGIYGLAIVLVLIHLFVVAAHYKTACFLLGSATGRGGFLCGWSLLCCGTSGALGCSTSLEGGPWGRLCERVIFFHRLRHEHVRLGVHIHVLIVGIITGSASSLHLRGSSLGDAFPSFRVVWVIPRSFQIRVVELWPRLQSSLLDPRLATLLHPSLLESLSALIHDSLQVIVQICVVDLDQIFQRLGQGLVDKFVNSLLAAPFDIFDDGLFKLVLR